MCKKYEWNQNVILKLNKDAIKSNTDGPKCQKAEETRICGSNKGISKVRGIFEYLLSEDTCY